jgi:hypothetical protein
LTGAQVGQLLTNLRVSSNNLLLPFTAQILQLLQDAPIAAPAQAGAVCAAPLLGFFRNSACLCGRSGLRRRLSW